MKTGTGFMAGILLFPLAAGHCLAAIPDDFKTTPITHEGRKWRVGYLEGGNTMSYLMLLHSTVKGLMELGWIERTETPGMAVYAESTRMLWQWLSENIESEYIEFVAHAYWSCLWDEEFRHAVKAEVLERLNRKGDIDLMIAMGTWAGRSPGGE